ncbi:porin family protein [Winogradskyella sp.]|uniref:porin family protein n=1 Tax=Winogradskyella sp. TaxID=1883156 RepID=UPI003F6C350B
MITKKLTLVIILISASLFSQEKISVGINSGLTYSNFRGNDFFDNYDYGFDFLIGFSVDYQIKSNLFIAADLNYDRKSTNYFYEDNTTVGPGGTIIVTPIGENPAQKDELKFQTRFEFITVPITLNYYIDNRHNFYINGGPYLSYLLNIKNIDDGEESDLNFNDEFNKLDFGLVMGIGYNLDLDEINYLSFELRNNFGLRKLNKNSNTIFDSTKTISLNLIISWNFYL